MGVAGVAGQGRRGEEYLADAVYIATLRYGGGGWLEDYHLPQEWLAFYRGSLV